MSVEVQTLPHYLDLHPTERGHSIGLSVSFQDALDHCLSVVNSLHATMAIYKSGTGSVLDIFLPNHLLIIQVSSEETLIGPFGTSPSGIGRANIGNCALTTAARRRKPMRSLGSIVAK